MCVSLRWGLFQDLVWCLTWCGTLWSGRVINAGKSRHNEDQACCEVVYVESRRNITGASREPSHNQVNGSSPFLTSRDVVTPLPGVSCTGSK